MWRVRLGLHSSWIWTLRWSNAYLIRAAVSVRLATVIMTGGVFVRSCRPIIGGFAPIVAEQVIAVHDQVRQRLLGPGPPVQIVLDLGIVVDVVEA